MYSALNKAIAPCVASPTVVNFNFIDGARVEVLSDEPGLFWVEFIDQDSQKILHSAMVRQNRFVKANIKYFVNFHIKVTSQADQKIIFEHHYNARRQKILFVIGSYALGDAIAWIPQIENFRKRHRCKVVVAGNHAALFAKNYPYLQFVPLGEDVSNVYAMYKVGLYFDKHGHGPGEINMQHHPADFRDGSVAKIAADILGLPFEPTRANVVFDKMEPPAKRYVCIAPHASDVMKYWHHPGGWQKIIDYINAQGYEVRMITYEKLGDEKYDKRLGGTLTGVVDKTGKAALSERAAELANAELFIGVGSGLSWLAWTVGCKVLMISGFSKPHAEFECERIFTPKPDTTCNGCFNRVRLDNSPPGFCPDHNGTKRMYECSKMIKPRAVIEGVKRQLKIGTVKTVKQKVQAIFPS